MTMKEKAKNTRQYKRLHVAYLVKYQINGKGEPRITNAKDISAGGLRFWTTENIPQNSLLKVSIYLPPLERSVEGLAKVLRIRKSKEGLVYYVAVSFLELKQEDREALAQFAETLSKDKDAQLFMDHADLVIRKKGKSRR